MTCCCRRHEHDEASFQMRRDPRHGRAALGTSPAATICVILGETGLKTEAAPPSRPAIAFAALPRRLAQEKSKRS
jgi:hypothetical protein